MPRVFDDILDDDGAKSLPPRYAQRYYYYYDAAAAYAADIFIMRELPRAAAAYQTPRVCAPAAHAAARWRAEERTQSFAPLLKDLPDR